MVLERWLKEALDTLQYVKLASPRAVVIENVPQLRFALQGEVWKAFRRILGTCGDTYKWYCGETCPEMYGSCFRRRRLWVVGILQVTAPTCVMC